MQKKSYKEMTVHELQNLQSHYQENVEFHQTVVIDVQIAWDYQQRIRDITQELGQRS